MPLVDVIPDVSVDHTNSDQKVNNRETLPYSICDGICFRLERTSKIFEMAHHDERDKEAMNQYIFLVEHFVKENAKVEHDCLSFKIVPVEIKVVDERQCDVYNNELGFGRDVNTSFDSLNYCHG